MGTEERRNDRLNERKRALFELIKARAYEKREVVLSSGRASNYYIDGKQITLSPDGLYLLASVIFEMIRFQKVDAIGGLTIGADPIAGAVALLSQIEGCPISAFIVRKEAKDHGKLTRIEGPPLKPGSRVVIVDDVITTGGSALKAAEAVRELGCEVVTVIALVDREEGGSEAFARQGLKFEPIFRRSELEE